MKIAQNSLLQRSLAVEYFHIEEEPAFHIKKHIQKDFFNSMQYVHTPIDGIMATHGQILCKLDFGISDI